MNPFDFLGLTPPMNTTGSPWLPGQVPQGAAIPTAPILPWQPPAGAPVVAPPTAGTPPVAPTPTAATPPVGGSIPEAVAAQLARWGATPSLVAPLLGQPTAQSPFGGGVGIGGEVARDAAAEVIPPTATAASGMAPPTAATPAAAGKSPFSGLSMPQAPQAQRISTPPPPKASPIKSGEWLALLQSLGVGAQAGFEPLSLGKAIGR